LQHGKAKRPLGAALLWGRIRSKWNSQEKNTDAAVTLSCLIHNRQISNRFLVWRSQKDSHN